ncbi:MAG: NUDIX hydrolase [Clostridia bacterium]|nr:NUDIX hydrolase [Clostridia bacterium]
MSFVEKKLDEQIVYEGKIFNVYHGRVSLPNGNIAFRDRIEHHGGAGILPLDEEGNIYLVKQYRYGVDKELLEIPAGKLEPGEDPQETVVRELQEEVGFLPQKVTSLGGMELSPAYLGEITYLYLGQDLLPSKAALDEDEFLEVIKMPFQEAFQWVLSGKITDGKTQNAILKSAILLGLSK